MMQKRYTRLHIVNYFTVLCFLGCIILSPSVLKAQLSISINSGGVTSVPTGQEVCFDVSYTWSSTTQDLNGAKIEVPVPIPLAGDVVGDVGVFNSPHIASSAYNPATRKITWTMIDPLPAGSSGTVKFCVHFANGTTTNGANVTITPTISGNGVLPASNSVSLTAQAAAKTTVTKNIRRDPALDNEATYTIVVNNDQGTGNYSLTNAVVTDVLPAGSTFVRASNGGTHSGGTVTWNLGNFPIGTSTTLRVTIIYPASNFSLGQSVTNTATLTGTTPEGSLPGISGSKTATIAAPLVEANTGKYSWTDWVSLGGGTGFSFYTNNNGNVPLNNYVVEEHIPEEYLLVDFGIGYDDNGTQSNVTVEYKTKNNTTWTTWPNSPFTLPANLAAPDRRYLSVWDLGFDPNGGTDYVTDLRFTWDNLPVGYSTDNASTYVNGRMINPTRNGVTYSMPLKIGNTINLKYDYNGNTTILPSVTDSTTIVPVSPKPVVSKSLNSAYNQQPNNEVQYQLCLNNNWDASDSLRDASIADLLPPNMTFVTGSLVNLASINAPVMTVTDNFNGTGRQLLKFSYQGVNIPVNTYNCFTINVKIKAGTPPGILRNQLYFMGASNSYINSCENPQFLRDTFDIDGDGITLLDTLPTSYNSELNVLETTAIESYKYVKGLCDSVFHRYPSVGKTTVNGTFEYKLYVKNVGNQPLTNIKTLDILPWVGDIGVLTYNDSRQTAYQPSFVSMDFVPPGITIKYSTSNNPCRADLDPAITEPGGGCDAGTFSTTIPTNLSDIRSLIFDFGSIIIQPADSLELRWTMRAPYGVGPGDVAWNSFGHRSESTTGTLVPPAEPIKVGVTVKSAKIGDLVWDDTNKDGIFNNGEVGIQGITIRLLDSLMNPVINPLTNQAVTTTSDASGNYFFNVGPGTYWVKFDLPSGYATSSANQGGDDATDSDIDNSGKTTTSITVVDGDNDLKWDAGIYQVCPVAPSISSITVDSATCTSGTANSDAKITLDGIAVATTYSYSAVSASNLFFSNATAISGSTISLTGLPNPSVPTTYYFRIYASDSLCYKDTSVILNPSVCPQPCIVPTITSAVITSATCTNGTPSSNATIAIKGISGMEKYAYRTNTTDSLWAINATASTADSIKITGIANPSVSTTYTFRLWSSDTTCYNDTIVTVYPINCAPCTKTIMYLCGFNKYNDALSYDHGMIDYLRAKGHTVTPAQTSSGNLINPETGNPINTISTFDKILVSHSAYFDVRDNVAFLLDSLKATTSGVLMLTSAGHVDLGIGTADGFDHSSGNIWIENNASPILPTGLPNGVVAIYNDSTTLGLDGYSSIVGWCSGVGSGAIIGAYRTSQPDPRVSYVGYKKGTTLANNTTAPGNRFFLGYLVEGASIYQPQIQVTDPNNFFTAEAKLILDEALEQTCPCCTPPTITGVSADTATCTNGVANSDAAVHVTGITGMTSYVYGTNGTTGLYATNATASTASSIDITGLANPASATTYTFRIYAADSTCYNDTTVILNPSVCPQCSITGTFTQNACNDNGTPATGTDDHFTVTITAVSATNGGASGKYEVLLNGTTVLNTGGTAYGSPITVGGSGVFSADGSTTYQLTVRDLDKSTCTTNVFTTTATANCSSCPPQICVPVAVSRN